MSRFGYDGHLSWYLITGETLSCQGFFGVISWLTSIGVSLAAGLTAINGLF